MQEGLTREEAPDDIGKKDVGPLQTESSPSLEKGGKTHRRKKVRDVGTTPGNIIDVTLGKDIWFKRSNEKFFISNAVFQKNLRGELCKREQGEAVFSVP